MPLFTFIVVACGHGKLHRVIVNGVHMSNHNCSR